MNIKKKMPKLLSVLLSFSMAFGIVIPAYATEELITESLLEEIELNETEAETAELEDTELNETDEENLEALDNEIEVPADSEGMYEEIEVNYSQASSYFVTIPKTITLGTDKKSPYSIKVSGDIAANKQVCVVPVDGITETEVFDFYMKDQTAGSTKADVVAEVSQAKFYWNHEDAKAEYEENDNYIIADGLSAGKWKGTFQMEISMRTDPSHIHNYVGEVTKEPTCTEPGEKTYTCDCGDSYTEEIPAKGHHYENGTCTDCGDKDPNHEHKYTEKVIKEPTCTEEGEKTYTCDCGDSYTEKIPAKGHHYENGTCTDCGDKDPNHKHDYTEKVTKEPTCTEEGEKTYTCDCGESYTEKIPATGHNYVDGECEHCGKKDDPYAVAPVGAYSDWRYRLDNENNKIILERYNNTKQTDVIVYGSYEINGKIYDTEVSSNLQHWSYTNIISTADYMFAEKSNIKTVIFSDNVDTSNIINMNCMFYECTSLTSVDFGNNFDTSNVTSTWETFYNCKKLSIIKGLENFDMSNVTDTESMFSGCYVLSNINISNWDVSNVTNMHHMFYACKSLTDFDLDLSKWNTGKVTNMWDMFSNCDSLTGLNISNWDVSNVTNMKGMFGHCISLIDLDLGNWDTSNVTNMESMFGTCKSLTDLDLNNWNTSSVTNMRSMFDGCSSLLELDLTSFDTSKVTDMILMFYNCTSLEKIDASCKWKVNSSCDTDRMFLNTNLSSVTKNHNFVDGICTICGEDSTYEFAPANAYKNWSYTLDDTNNIITLKRYLGSEADVIVYANYDVKGTIYKTQILSSTKDQWSSGNAYYMFSGNKTVETIRFSSLIDTRNLTNMTLMFSECSNLNYVDFGSNFDTSNVTKMAGMFSYCKKLNHINFGDKFDTSNVTDMHYMFYGCSYLTNLDLTSFDTSKVTDMKNMFYNCSVLENLNLSSFDTSKVKNMSYMFDGCKSLTSLDLSSFDTGKVTNMDYMFRNCSKLANIYVTEGKWVTDQASKSSMFSSCGTSSVTYK